MSLHGTLETFALPDVMALLAATKKTGELRVVGGRLDGRVHLDGGQVVSAEVGRADSLVDAVFELLRLTTGKFSFDADKPPTSAGEPADVEPLLLEAQARLAEWRDIETVVPSLEAGVHLVGTLADPHVTLASEQWRLVVAVAGARTVQDVADRLELGDYAVSKALKDLVDTGVVEMGPAPTPAAAPEDTAAPEDSAAEPAADADAEAEEADVDAEAEAEAPAVEPAVTISPLTSTPGGPAPPGEEPPTPKGKKVPGKADEKPEPVKAEKAPNPEKPERADEDKAEPVSAAQAKQLVSQLAALSAESKPKAKAKVEDKAGEGADAPEDTAESTAKPAAKPAPAKAEEPGDEAASTEGGEEPLNRGLLLKFLSSVRQ